MQLVSTRWLENQRQKITSESELKIVFNNVWDDALPPDTTFEDNGSAPHGVTSAIQSNRKTAPPKYVSFEQNLWVLDGRGVVLPETGGRATGFISADLGDQDGEFITYPEVRMNLGPSGGLRVSAVTIEWDKAFGDHAVTFEVIGYLNGESVFGGLVAWNTTPTSTVNVPQEVCDTVVVRILKWSTPHRRARLDSLTVEHLLTCTKRSITKFEHYQEVDPLSASLPKAGVRFSIDNTDDRFNPYNPGSTLYGQLTDRPPVEVRYGFKLGGTTEAIPGGKFYISGWEAPQNGITADFEAVDKLGLLRERTYEKGTYSPSGVSLADLARGVIIDAGVFNGWHIDPVLENIHTVAPLPVVSHAECLQIIANAGGCTLGCDRDDVIYIRKFTPPSTVGFRQSGAFSSGSSIFLPLGVSPQTYPIDSSVSYRRPELRTTKPITRANVSRFSYSVDDSFTELYRATIPTDWPSPVGFVRLNPTYEPSAEVFATVTGGGTIDLANTRFYTRGCDLQITVSGEFEVVVKGKKIHVTEAIESVGEPGGETQVIKNPLITDVTNALAVGGWALEYLSNRNIISFDWRADPRLDANDVINMSTKYGSSHVLMHDFTMSYNGVFRGRGEGRDIGALGDARF